MLITTYDYWGYYNICYLAGEVEKPERNVPRAVLISIALVAAIYLLMNISVLGVIPWHELAGQTSADARVFGDFAFSCSRFTAAGRGKMVTALIIWTAFGSVFSLLLGYSRVPYAAALDGNYFAVFGRLHPKHRFPVRFAAGAGSGGRRLLRVAAGGRDRGAGGDSHCCCNSCCSKWAC